MQRSVVTSTARGMFAATFALAGIAGALAQNPEVRVSEDEQAIRIVTPQLEAAVRKKGYVSGVAAQSFLDRKTGFRDPGFGLDIVDWIMEPGSDEAIRPQLPKHMIYEFGNLYHGKSAKRMIEGPQICTQARELSPTFLRGPDFVAVKQSYRYTLAAPGHRPGSTWTQTIVFPAGKRYFLSADRIDAVNDSPAMFLRIDLPGHIKHNRGDTFREVYLSYHGRVPSSEFFENFAPDEKFNYRRERWEKAGKNVPERMIRAYRLRDPKTGADGPWLAGMTLEPSVVSEAWCHQRSYVCFIQEFGERPVRAGESFSAAFLVGYFDTVEEMHAVYDAHKGFTGLRADARGWELLR